jgi:tungstate transport system permease protein
VDFLLDSVSEAVSLVLSGDREVFHALWVSLICTGAAVLLAFLLAVPYGAWLAYHRPRGHGFQVHLLWIGMFVPTVAIGLVVYGLLSRRGLLGGIDLLYTQVAIAFGQFLLAFPVLGALAHGAAASQDPVVLETARTLGASPFGAMRTALSEARTALAAALLTAFARCFTELGIATTVGGNLRLRTRTLPGTIQLELSAGNFAKALAPGLLILVVAVLTGHLAWRLSAARRRTR